MSTSAPAPAAYHHGDLRRTLVAAARAALDENGAERLGLREIARRAGVSPAAPYRHFAGLEDLLQAVAAQGFDELAAALDAAAGDPGDRLAAMGRAYVRFARAHPRLYRLMFAAGAPAAAAAGLAAAGRSAFARLEAAVTGERERNPREARLAALSAWAHVHGLSLLLLDGRIPRVDAGNPDDEERLVAALTDRFVAGLRSIL